MLIKKDNLNLELNLYDPRFLPACEKTLNELDKKFSKYFNIKKEIIYDYELE
jgi:hypothetical protein